MLKLKLPSSRKSSAAEDPTATGPRGEPKVPEPLQNYYLGRHRRLGTQRRMYPLEMSLLDRHLNAFQWRELTRTGFIPVRGSAGGGWFIDWYTAALFQQIPLASEKGIGLLTPQLTPQAIGLRGHGLRHRCLNTFDATFLDCVLAKVLLVQTDEQFVDKTAN